MSANAIKKARIVIQMDIMAESQRHERKLRQLNKRLCDLQKTCSHPNSTFHGDPAGGFDSCHECEDCRKVW